MKKHEILSLILPEIGLTIREASSDYIKGSERNSGPKLRDYYVIQVLDNNNISVFCFNDCLLKEIVSKLRNVKIIEEHHYLTILELEESQ